MVGDTNCIMVDSDFWRGFVDALRHDNIMPWTDTKAIYDNMLVMKTDEVGGTVLTEILSHALPGTSMKYITKGIPLLIKEDAEPQIFRVDYLTFDADSSTLFFVEFRLPGRGVGWKRYDHYASLLGDKNGEKSTFSVGDLRRMYEKIAKFNSLENEPKNRYYQTQWKELAPFLEYLNTCEQEVTSELIYLLPEPFDLAKQLSAREKLKAPKDMGERFHVVALSEIAKVFTGGSSKTRCFFELWRYTQTTG